MSGQSAAQTGGLRPALAGTQAEAQLGGAGMQMMKAAAKAGSNQSSLPTDPRWMTSLGEHRRAVQASCMFCMLLQRPLTPCMEDGAGVCACVSSMLSIGACGRG